MKQGTAKALEYFVGKVCTIFLQGQLSRAFSDQQFNDYFVGVVDMINEDCIITTHPITACKNYYPFSSIVGISEEQVLDPAIPEEAKLIAELKKSGVVPKEVMIEPEMLETDSPYADIEIMTDLAKQAKEIENNR